MFTTTTSRFIATCALGFASLASAACGENKFKGAMMLGGQKVSSEQLEHGREVYVHYCRACHGDEGNGQGASSAGLRPPPRDFRAGQFKFGSVTGGLPSDDDFKRIVRYGLKGTAMLPWDIEPHDLDAVIQYIKAFSPRWQPPQAPDPKTGKAPPYFKQGETVAPSHGDPWKLDAQKEMEGIERGKFLYHQKAQCGSCHPNYVTKAELSAFNKKDTGVDLQEFRADLYGSQLKESSYKVGADADGSGGYAIKLLPPDFLTVDTRSVRTQLGKPTALEDLYRVIAGGINGTPMPTWRGTVFEAGHDSDDDLWALCHYVYSLIEKKGTMQAVAMAASLNDSANIQWHAPPPPVEAPTPTPTETAPSGSASTEGASSAAPPSTSASTAPSSSAPGAKGSASAKPPAPKPKLPK